MEILIRDKNCCKTGREKEKKRKDNCCWTYQDRGDKFKNTWFGSSKHCWICICILLKGGIPCYLSGQSCWFPSVLMFGKGTGKLGVKLELLEVDQAMNRSLPCHSPFKLFRGYSGHLLERNCHSRLQAQGTKSCYYFQFLPSFLQTFSCLHRNLLFSTLRHFPQALTQFPHSIYRH